MDTGPNPSGDLVTTGATVSNADRPPGTDIYQWLLSSFGTSYRLETDPTVGYINSTNDVDIYYWGNSIGAPGLVNTDHRYLYIVTEYSFGSGTATTDITDQYVGIGGEFGQTGGGGR
jgi:hypothetical protein